jgi:hypothetical protein
MDGGTPVTGSTAHSELATVGAIDRATNGGREKTREP